jgi:hypothetical protein
MNHAPESIGWKIFDIALGLIVVALLIYLAAQTLIFTGKALAYVTGEALDRQAESECIGWALEAKRHTPYSEANPGGYYLTSWQDEQCRSVGIHVNAPVL